MNVHVHRLVKKQGKEGKDHAEPNLSERESGIFVDHLQGGKIGRLVLVVGGFKVNGKNRIDHGLFTDGIFCNHLRARGQVAGNRRKVIASPDADEKDEQGKGDKWDFVKTNAEPQANEDFFYIPVLPGKLYIG